MTEYRQRCIDTLFVVSCLDFEKNLRSRGITFCRLVYAGSVSYLPRDVARDWQAWKAGIQWAEENRV